MRKKLAALLTLAGVLGMSPVLAEVTRIEFTSANRGTSIDQLFKGKAKYDETIFGDLSVPENTKGKVPAVVLMHGSGGANHVAYKSWIEFLNKMGVATFLVDSFTNRGITGTASDQSQLTYTTSGIDALKALQALASDSRIDPSKVGIMGFSRGGVATQVAAFERYRSSVLGSIELKFAVHLPFYGGCTQYGKTTGAPVIHFVGEADQTMDINTCKATTQLINGLGGNVSLVVYPGAYHGFDYGPQPYKYFPDGQTWKSCRFTTNVDDLTNQIPGNQAATTGEVVAYRKTCVKTGFAISGDRSADRQSRQDVAKAIKSAFGL